MSEPHLTSEPAENVMLVGYLHRLDWSAEQFAYRLNDLARSLQLSDRIHPKTPPALAQGPAARVGALYTPSALAGAGVRVVVTPSA